MAYSVFLAPRPPDYDPAQIAIVGPILKNEGYLRSTFLKSHDARVLRSYFKKFSKKVHGGGGGDGGGDGDRNDIKKFASLKVATELDDADQSLRAGASVDRPVVSISLGKIWLLLPETERLKIFKECVECANMIHGYIFGMIIQCDAATGRSLPEDVLHKAKVITIDTTVPDSCLFPEVDIVVCSGDNNTVHSVCLCSSK